MEMEIGFKELHEGIYTWGAKKLEIAKEKGYVESAAGFKLYLSNFNDFKDLERWYDTLDSDFWDDYMEGKKIAKKRFELNEKLDNNEELSEKDLEIHNNMGRYMQRKSYRVYEESRQDISRFAKLKSEYFKICLNNPKMCGALHSDMY